MITVKSLESFIYDYDVLGTCTENFSEASLRDLIVQSDVLAIGSADKVCSGKMFNRAVCVHKLVHEGLHRFN